MIAKCVVVWVTTTVILTSGTTTTEQSQSRGGGSRRVQLGEFPFLVLLEILEDNKTVCCSGSIPSPTTVLTCYSITSPTVTAYAGLVSSEEKELRNGQVQVRSVESTVVHTGLTVCYVNQSWEWTELVAPVALQLGEGSLQPSFVTSCQVVSFGQTEPDGRSGAAHVMDQLVGSGSQCEEKFIFIHFLPFHDFFRSDYMCSVNVENKTICGEYPGGPVVCGGQQWAIVMGKDRSDDDLDDRMEPSRYLYVAFFRDWIRMNIKDLPSSADCVRRCSLEISVYEALLYQPLWLTLVMTVQLLYLH